jgi:hypothetical protein
VRISRLPLWSPETKCHLDVGSMANHIVYYKGEGGVKQLFSLYSRFYKVTMLKNTNVIGERKK